VPSCPHETFEVLIPEPFGRGIAVTGLEAVRPDGDGGGVGLARVGYGRIRARGVMAGDGVSGEGLWNSDIAGTRPRGGGRIAVESTTSGDTAMIARIVCCSVLLTAASAVVADNPKQAELAKKPQWQRMLTGEDAKRAAEWKQEIEASRKRLEFEAAEKKAVELLEFLTGKVGADVNADREVVLPQSW
jgi:hypothetical protein